MTYKVAWTWAHKLRSLMELGTTLASPVPPFDAERRAHVDRNHLEAARRRWFLAHGHLEWDADRPGGLGKCCDRLGWRDWEGRVPLGRLVERARRRLYMNYSGHVSDHHLRAYLKETEFRINHQRVPVMESVVELMGRFARRGARFYREIRAERSRREPIQFWGPGVDRIPAAPARPIGDDEVEP
ncbi:MAG TPA: hypothetical protein VFF73_13840 [Planctomycetota bacterium]|nr:hypothetical protein [Planctomycetota bacterium]